MSAVVVLAVVLPLLASMVALGVRHLDGLRDLVTLGALGTSSVLAMVLLVHVEANGSVVVRLGGWAPELGIVLVADMFAVLVLAVAMITILLVEVFAIGQRGTESGAEPNVVGPMLLVLTAGVALSVLTGDLFTLFVAFELMLVASYVLLTLGGRPGQVRSGMSYVVISLVASTFFITALALIYAATGTVNMAELSQRIPELSDGVRTGFSLLLILVFGIKAGLFPLFFWLPDSYPTAPGAITAVFAGLLTKVGVYAIIRSQTLLFPPEAQQGSFLLVLAGFTMVIGVLGALAQDDLRRMLSFHIVSHIGYMIFGLALFTLAGIAGAVFYVVHHIVVKTALFLVAGLVERRAGSDRLSRIGGLVRSAPMIAVLFALPALSIAGLPPFSGFVGKFALVGSGIESDEWAIVAVSLIVSLLTMYVMVRIWSGVFWGEPEDPAIASWIASDESRVPHLMTGAATAVVGLSVALMIFAGPLYDYSKRTAEDLLAPDSYVEAVIGDHE
jgi:multicomponent Na+:H+ antiporter subunit D